MRVRGMRTGRARLAHALVAAGVTAGVAAGLCVPGAIAGPPPPGPGPMLGQGTNGYAAPANGSAKMVDEGLGGKGALLTSIGNGQPSEAGYGLVSIPGGPGTAKTFGALTDVETQFNVTQGTCVGGAPRWVIDLTNPSTKQTQFLIVYFDNAHQPYGGCNAGTQQETNIINNSSTGWFVGNANSSVPYSQVLSTYGSWTLKDVQVQVDGGWESSPNGNIQQVLLQDLKVNNATYFPLP